MINKMEDKLTRDEIRKMLMKQKPTAVRYDVDESDTNVDNYKYKTTITHEDKEIEVFFEVPISDMGVNVFPDEELASYLGRWIKI